MTGMLNLLALFIIFGVVLWIVNAYIPMPSAIKSLLNLVAVIILILYVLQFFGLIAISLPVLHIFK